MFSPSAIDATLLKLRLEEVGNVLKQSIGPGYRLTADETTCFGFRLIGSQSDWFTGSNRQSDWFTGSNRHPWFKFGEPNQRSFFLWVKETIKNWGIGGGEEEQTVLVNSRLHHHYRTLLGVHRHKHRVFLCKINDPTSISPTSSSFCLLQDLHCNFQSNDPN